MRFLTARLTGGLGNQLFQFANIYSLSLRSGSSLRLDLSYLAPSRKITQRRYALGFFDHGASLLSRPRRLQSINRFCKQYFSFFFATHIYTESGLDYSSEITLFSSNSYFTGYYQSYKYFDDHSLPLAQLINRGIDNFSNDAFLLLNKIRNVSSVAIHIRHGDYISNSNANKTHGVLPLRYYLDTINYLQSIIHKPYFFVFSDNIEWAKENLGSFINMFFVDSKYNTDDWEQLLLMAQCNHIITANSSFSWWSAWIGDHISPTDLPRYVCYPRKWFSNISLINYDDRFPVAWKMFF